MANEIERGEIHFFYLARFGAAQVTGTEDLQRFFLALVPDSGGRARLFVVGRKQMPEIVPGEALPVERNWMMLTLVDDPESVGRALHPERYETETRGERETSEAIPAGSGRYAIVRQDDATRLAYRLARPSAPGKAQDALNIASTATYVLAVRNPDVEVPGFPKEPPDYPKDLAEMFADERWIDVSDPRLLDHENAQFVLIGAREDGEPPGVDLDGDADPFATFRLDAEAWPEAPLREGSFAAPEREAEPVEAAGDRSKGGKRGGRAAARVDSAAGVASALDGVSFPAGRSDLIGRARENDAPPEVVELLREMPDERFGSMADVAKAIGEVR